MEFRILGPVEVVHEDGPVALTRAKQRALLAILLLDANRVVPTDVVIDRLWPRRPPASAAKLVHVYASQLRRSLGRAANRIATQAPGYVLRVEPDELDAARFERLLADGRAALADGSPARAHRILTESLELWRGRALADVAYEEFARTEADRLEELRIVALEERIEADLALGRHEEVLEALRALTEQHPLRERLRGQLMLALYRAGRQVEALEAYATGRKRLREELGLDPDEELRRLHQAILRHAPDVAAPLRTRPRTNLPSPVTALVGRGGEVEELVAALRRRDRRLLTLTGAGGSGKTTLALAAARAVANEFADGAVLVELAGVQDANLVVPTIAAALGADLDVSEAPEDAVAKTVEPQELLLLIDNFEHLREAGPVLVTLLEAAPRLQLLVTSRVVLHLSAETVFPVPPLEPEAARALFLERAEAAAPEFAAADADAELLGDICRRLDHLPLALELVAPRLRVFSLDALSKRLSDGLPLRTTGQRDLPARQQTLRATVEWSLALLAPDARRLLARLASFPGGFGLEAAEAVWDAEGAAADLLAELLDASLVRRRGDRFELLESIRQLALELLESSGEQTEVGRLQAEYLLGLAGAANLTIEAEGPMRHDDVIAERDNVRAALAWASDNDPELGLELMFALENYWVTAAAPFEGRRMLEELLDRAGELADALRACAMRVYGNVLIMCDEPDGARRAYEESLAAYRRLGDGRSVGIMLQRLAIQVLRLGEAAKARSLCEESLRLHRASGFEKGEAVGIGVLANLELRDGNDQRARELYELSANLAGRTGFVWYQAGVLLTLAGMMFERGRFADAEDPLREAVALARRMQDRRQAVLALAMLARAAVETERAGRAGQLWGAIEAEESRAFVAGWETARQRYADAVLAHQGPSFAAGREQGRRLSLDEAIDVALAAG